MGWGLNPSRGKEEVAEAVGCNASLYFFPCPASVIFQTAISRETKAYSTSFLPVL